MGADTGAPEARPPPSPQAAGGVEEDLGVHCLPGQVAVAVAPAGEGDDDAVGQHRQGVRDELLLQLVGGGQVPEQPCGGRGAGPGSGGRPVHSSQPASWGIRRPHPLDLAAPAPVPLPHGAFESFLCGPRWCPREAVFRRDRHVRSLTERSRPAGHGRSAPGLRRCPVLSGAAERLVLGPALRASVVLDTGRMRKTCGPRTPAPTSPKVCSGRAVAGHQPSTPRPLSSEGPRPPVTLHSAWVDPPGPHGLLRGVPGYEAGLGPALTESRPRGRAPYRSAASGSPCSRSSAGG